MLENMPLKKSLVGDMENDEVVDLPETISKHYKVPKEAVKKELDEIADSVRMLFQEKEGQTLTTTRLAYSMTKLLNEQPTVKDFVTSIYLMQSLTQLGRLLFIDEVSNNEEKLEEFLEALDLRDKLIEGSLHLDIDVRDSGVSINVEIPRKTLQSLSKEIVRANREEQLTKSLMMPVLELFGAGAIFNEAGDRE